MMMRRIQILCDQCNQWVPIGRIVQHEGTATCYRMRGAGRTSRDRDEADREWERKNAARKRRLSSYERRSVSAIARHLKKGGGVLESGGPGGGNVLYTLKRPGPFDPQRVDAAYIANHLAKRHRGFGTTLTLTKGMRTAKRGSKAHRHPSHRDEKRKRWDDPSYWLKTREAGKVQVGPCQGCGQRHVLRGGLCWTCERARHDTSRSRRRR